MRLGFGKTLISLSLRNPSHLHKIPIPYSISLLFFSSKPKESKPTVTVLDYLINKHQFSHEVALKASSVIACLKRPIEVDSMLSFFKESGFSKTHIEEVVNRVPEVLTANLASNIKPKIQIFQNLGFSPDDIAEIVSSDPWILKRSADNRLGPSILMLKTILGSNAEVIRALKVSGWFLTHDLEKTMKPNIEFMKGCGVSSSQIVKYMFNFPRFFLHKPESIQEFVKTVEEMGFDRKSKMFLAALRTVSSMTHENWVLKLELFRSLGFSENDILSVFRRVPQVFSISERKIKEVTELLLSAWNIDISYIVRHPELLICSIEHRLKPRLRVLEILEKENALKKKPGLTTVCKITDKKFLEKFVLPYSKEIVELNVASWAS